MLVSDLRLVPGVQSVESTKIGELFNVRVHFFVKAKAKTIPICSSAWSEEDACKRIVARIADINENGHRSVIDDE